MNPLLISVEDNFTMTEAGKHNIKNISEEFNCHIISLKPSIKAQKIIMRHMFEKYAKPTYYTDRLIYTFPIQMALRLGIKLVVYGENTAYEYGGLGSKESYSAMNQIENGAASGIDHNEFLTISPDYDLYPVDLELLKFPSKDKLEEAKIEPIYLSYFYRWNDYSNYIFAKSRGFKDLVGEWRRTHHIDDYSQVDSLAYAVHYWLKYPKFGFQYASDLASRWIRLGLIDREKAIELAKKYDYNLDQRSIDDFCDFCGYSISEFWKIVEPFYNRDLFKKDKFGRFVPKYPIWEENNE